MVKPSPVAVSGEPGGSLPTTEDPHSLDGSTTKVSQSTWQSTVKYLKTEITLEHADIPIIACCVVSGLCDSSAYNAWSCFVSMQTGNTIFLALGASGQPITHPYGWVKSMISIIFFLCGCLFFAQTRLFNPKSRGTLAVSFFLQSACIIVAAALVQANVVPSPKGVVVEGGDDVDFLELIPLAFLAFQSGGQIVTSRLLGFNEVPTTVLTSVYCDLSSDPKVLAKDNIKRNRRVCAVLGILIGGIAGGWISRSAATLSTSFWLAAAIKMGIAIGWSVWKPKSSI
ncbi:hypothetical protein LHYA1_G000281 [Lachnellula hyalina]|uniref:DUF1275 domain protein n=1 Tax=Lachnellula hyalina TaxID=1316788 RepID=A0A8H8RAM6_9HELO|nr:uncharacterized protein LHYA1_G000281 [Lachnellula hyalina]TVY31054.1 hypothetical protein LHYA1_G000281 [Lachnellula hyalina]